ncbi:MAG TPA: hypothetical protein VEC60_19250 [Reyranella sp.]|nr:hypothetical protein [Reyranella sp.]
MDPVSGPIPEQHNRVAISPSFATRAAGGDDRSSMDERLSRIRSVSVSDRRAFLARAAAAPVLLIAAPAASDNFVPAGTVQISQTQIAFMGSANLGGGKLNFGGKSYPFTIGGLGIGGFGFSKIEATGTVFNLKSVGQFSGAYAQGRYGLAVGDKSTGELWLTNVEGVAMSLKAKREGLALSLGGDAIYIDLA